MNYNEIFSRGSNYVNSAGQNWNDRKHKLIHYWATLHEDSGNGLNISKKARVNVIIDQLELRMKILLDMIHEMKKKKERERFESENSYIQLMCLNMDCRYGSDAVITCVLYRDYVEGKFKCHKCGSALVGRDYFDVDEMLLDLNINLKQ